MLPMQGFLFCFLTEKHFLQLANFRGLFSFYAGPLIPQASLVVIKEKILIFLRQWNWGENFPVLIEDWTSFFLLITIWRANPHYAALQNINLKIKKGEFIGLKQF